MSASGGDNLLFRGGGLFIMSVQHIPRTVKQALHVKYWQFGIWISGGEIFFHDDVVKAFIGDGFQFSACFLITVILISFLHNLI